MSVLEGTPRPLDAVTNGLTAVGILRISDVQRLVDETPRFGWNLAVLTSRNHRFALDFVAAMLGATPIEKISVLFRLGATETLDGAPTVRITQSELAAVAGVSRQRANATLSELEREGRIDRRYGAIRILDQNLLRPSL